MSLNKSKTLRAAEKYVLQGKIPAAIEEYKKVVDADPSDLTTINTLGDLYVRAGRIQDAITNFSRIAESYREGGFTLKAIAMLKKISKLDPTNVETAMKLANLYSQQGLLVEARQQYLQVADSFARVGQTRKALDAYQKIADLDPTNTSVRMKLGEIYSRESMMEQAHDSFLTAGIEFLRKGDTEQALNANLKAIGINPDSCQALSAIATIYTQRGQADRAINILCDAFEKNPGDVELLTILGRTYLASDMMDDAERTFLSLVELDRNRYHYLLEVGRKFLQLGDLDRAAEQIDGCLDLLITRREEDKAIDFLRRILDRDINHVGALKRMAQIFTRIREDHNLVATLNSLAEAAMHKGDDAAAIEALKDLARLEPGEPMHLQRLYNLGVQDIAEAPDVIRPTGPLDIESSAFDDAFVIRQISEAEILAGHGQVDQAVSLLKEILHHTPENLQVHLKLKDIYLRAGIMDKAASECLELARIHEGRGEMARHSDYLAEARQLNPLMELPTPLPASEAPGDWYAGGEKAFEFGPDFAIATDDATGGAQADFGPLPPELSMYDTGFPSGPEPAAEASAPVAAHAFRLDDAPGDAAGGLESGPPQVLDDSMARALQDELEGVDFYIAQGYMEIARDTLNRLRHDYGEQQEILSRFKAVGMKGSTGKLAAVVKPSGDGLSRGDSESAPGSNGSMYGWGEPASGNGSGAFADPHIPLTIENEAGQELPAPGSDFSFTVADTPADGEHKNALPVMVHKESGPLQSDIMLQFNTGEFLKETLSDPLPTPAAEIAATLLAPPPPSTGDLIDSMMSNIDFAFHEGSQAGPAAVAETPLPGVESGALAPPPVSHNLPPADPQPLEVNTDLVVEPEAIQDELHAIFEELNQHTGDLQPVVDYETAYNLGLAYKDMDLFDDAIEQFQAAFRAASIEDTGGNYIQCCHMLGVCFTRKGMPKLAIMWFQRGLGVPNRTEDEYQALRFEIAAAYEEMGEIDKAIDTYMEVYGIDVNYRGVSSKLKELQSVKSV